MSLELVGLDTDRAEEAVTRALKHLGDDYGKIRKEELRTEAIRGIKVSFFNATGENEDGGDVVIRGAVFQATATTRYSLLVLVCSPGAAKRHEGDLKAILASVSAVAK